MQTKAFIIAGLAALAVADINSDLASLTSQLGGLSISIPTEEASVLSVLETAIPSDVQASITDPAYLASVQSAFSAGVTPSWYSNLPDDVKSFIGNAGALTSGADISSIASQATGFASSVVSQYSASAASRVSEAVSSATGNAAGPAPTGALFASMAGAVGVLALAVGL